MRKWEKYGAILADPPWNWKAWSKKGEAKSASQHYSLMTLDDVKQMQISSMAATDCALFLWAIDSMLPQALEVIDAWGFTFKTVAFTWVKQTKDRKGFPIGTGYWTRANPEMCLFATRGKPKRLDRGVRQVILDVRRQHSRKPDVIYERIGKLVCGPYMELFARQQWPGWDCLGDEVDKF